MQLKEFDILLDIKNHNKSETFEVVQGDSHSNILNITLVNGLNSFNLTNTDVEIVFNKSDGTTVQQTDISIINEAQGRIQCVLKTNTIASPGKIIAEVRVLEGEILLTSARFEFYVRKSLIDDETIESTNEFPILMQLINDVEPILDAVPIIEDKLDEITNTESDLNQSIQEGNSLKTDLDNSITQGNILKPELEGVILEGTGIKGELEDIIAGTGFEQVITDLKNKVDKEIVGELIDLDTTDKSNIVNAINEIDNKVGPLASLTTLIKTSIVNAINSLRGEVNEHKADYVNFKNNIEAVKYEGDKLFLKVNGEWIEFKSGSQYPVGNVIDFNAKGGDKQITLTWQDPADTTIDDSLGNPVPIAKWKGTKILRKIGSYPVNENDGVLVVDNGIRDQYKTNGFIDTGLVNDTEYFYMAFPYTEEDVYTVDESSRISATPTEIKIYGIEIDESNSNPETAVIYTDDAVGFTPASGNNGAFNWGSWESIIKDEFKIRPCVLNNPAKTVNYYLSYDNYNLKATGGASVLTGADGDVMTEFGADIYTKWTVVGSKHKIQFSIKPFEGATKNAFETENGYNQFAYYPLLLTQKLFQMIFKNRDGQTALGRGYVDGNSAYANTGGTNTKGFMFGETTGKQQMKFLGIEDYWGNKYQWLDGLVTDASFNLLIGNSGFNDSGSGYTNYSSGVSANFGGYIDKVQGGNDKGFIIRTGSGSATTHYCDYGRLNSGLVARFGGYRSGGSGAGFAQLQLDGGTSDAIANNGARLMCVNNGKLYIGAYLGTTQNGKLRSVSGTTPSDNKTIGVFRNEAKANNV